MPLTLTALAAALAAAAVWLYRRRRLPADGGDTQAALPERLREQLDRAKAQRLAGETGAGYELLVDAARHLETPEERQDLERRLESVRFGGDLPDGAELEAIERRLERALGRLQPDPDAERRRRLHLRPRPDGLSTQTRKETSG